VPEKGAGCGLTSPYERSVLGFRADPRMRGFAERNYLDEDLQQAVSRYASSNEFSRICTILRPYLASGSRLLDIGAGRGLTSLALAQRGAHVISVESDPSEVVGVGALGKFRRKPALPLTPVRGDILRLPFADRCFDVIFCRSVLHHLRDLGEGLRESYRVLKPGGTFLAVNEHILALLSNGKRFLKAHPATAFGVNENAYHIMAYWRKLRRAGFRDIHFYGYPLELPEFLVATRSNRVRSHLVGLPVGGRVFLALFHKLHVALRRYIVVPEETLPAISMVARKRRPSSAGNR
jgi:ubiquinone/menaquinone biosynthesis C-methylase UbiE